MNGTGRETLSASFLGELRHFSYRYLGFYDFFFFFFLFSAFGLFLGSPLLLGPSSGQSNQMQSMYSVCRHALYHHHHHDLIHPSSLWFLPMTSRSFLTPYPSFAIFLPSMSDCRLIPLPRFFGLYISRVLRPFCYTRAAERVFHWPEARARTT